MNDNHFSTTLLVDQAPKEVFDAINNVRGWWGEGIAGGTHQLNDEFKYRHREFHYSEHRITEMIPNKKVVWLVTNSTLSFIEDKNEWTGTKIIFEIAEKNGKTELRFTHEGLTPEVECFDACTGSGGWSYYLHESLLSLITTGKGKPDKKEIGMIKSETVKE